MKITIIAPEFPPRIGGMEKYAFELAKNFSKDNDVSVVTREDYSNIDYKNVGLDNVNVVPILTLDFDEDVSNIINYIKNNNIDIIHINNAGFSPALLKIKSKLNVPVVITAHGKDFIEPFTYSEKNKEIKDGLISADKIITVSNFVKGKLIDYGVNENNIEVISHGTYPNLFKPKQKNKQLLKKHSISSNDKILLSVCRVHQIKALERIIKVIPSLLKKGYCIKYLIVGPISDLDYFKSLTRLIKRLDLEENIVFVKEADDNDLVDYYNLCYIHILLSGSKKLKESFGISFIEASSCSKAVIGSKDSGASDAIIDGETGFLVDPENEEEVITKIIKLLENKELRERLGKNSRERVVKELTWENCSRKVLQVYKDVLKTKPGIVNFNKYPLANESFINGANLYYNEVSKILGEEDFGYFNFIDIIKNNNVIKKIKNKDTIITNCGPYAYIYHYLRQKYGLKFRIIRDVQAALWSGYLLQESICSKMQQEEDVILFPSEYARQIYIKLFPHITKDNSFVCYPCMKFFPRIKIEKNKDYDNSIDIGYLGRVSYEKNFKQLLEAFINVSKEIKAKLLVAGRIEDVRFMPNNVKKMLIDKGVNNSNYVHINNGNYLPYPQIWEFLQKVDVLVFPSSANIETLGRAVMEAAHLGIPVIAAEHAASPELMDKKNLVRVNYFRKASSLLGTCALGSIDVDELCDKIMNYKKLSKKTNINNYKNHNKKLLRIIEGKEKRKGLRKLSPRIADFIKNIDVIGINVNENIIEKTIDIIKNLDYRRLNNAKLICEKVNFKPYLNMSLG